ncbi:MAG: hypothetical protein O7G83_12730 [Proteobacteria bacterium]|nr:hypothetical protein [Pseudomonadota bacterium]
MTAYTTHALPDMVLADHLRGIVDQLDESIVDLFNVDSEKLLARCGCKRTATLPYCDGTDLNPDID